MRLHLATLLIILATPSAAGILLAPALFRHGATTAAPLAAAEPSAVAKFVRRSKVYWLAARLFASIKVAQRKDRSLRQRLGLGEDDEHEKLEIMWDSVHEKNAAMLCRNIIRLSGFWVKVGQYLSSRADVMPPQYLRLLSTLQDAVPPKPFGDVVQTLREELGEEQQALLQSIDDEPLSTASLAQVHRATLVDGRQVVVKAQHRGVASLMRQDMANLRSILGVVARFDKDADFGPVVKEWTAEVLKELDFRTEASNMAEVRALLARRRIRAIVPAAVDALVTQRVLVMDFCDGFAIKDTARLDAEGVDRDVLLQRVCEAWAAQMHVAGVFNADPHPGNILVSTAPSALGGADASGSDGSGSGGIGGDVSQGAHDPSVPVLLDFGLTKRFTPGQTVAFARLVHASEESDVDGLLQSFDEMGLKLNRYDPFQDMAAMRRSLSDTVPASEAKAQSKQRRTERKEEIMAQREAEGVPKGGKLRSPIDAWPPELVFFTRVTAMLRGLCSSLEVRHPYLSTMAASARVTIRDSIPAAEHAKAVVYQTPRGVKSSPLQMRLESVAADLVGRGEAVGLQVHVRQRGKVLADVAAGTLGTADPRPVTQSSLFNVFSVSKAVLALGVHKLIEDGSVALDDTVASHWPAFAAKGKEHVTVRHLLSHQAGLASAMPPAATLDTLCDWGNMTSYIAAATPEHEAGAETRYHYLTFGWLCGGLIEAVTGAPYEHFLSSRILEPSLSVQGLSDQIHMGGLPEDVEAARLAVLSVDRRGREATSRVQRHQAGSDRDDASAGEASGSEVEDDAPRRAKLAKYQGRADAQPVRLQHAQGEGC